MTASWLLRVFTEGPSQDGPSVLRCDNGWVDDKELDAQLSAWCSAHLGAAIVETLFRADHLSTVIGARLRDDRRIVLKLRLAEERLYECFAVQRHLWQQGYACPRPLAEPALLEGRLLTAEEMVDGGEAIEGSVAVAAQYASALERQVRLCETYRIDMTLAPAPPWLGGWEHDGAGLWPPPDDPVGDLNDHPDPGWLDEVARRVKPLLRSSNLPCVIGHVDWHSGNLRWRGDALHVAYDWDSLAYLSEAAIAGGASVIYTASLRAEAHLEESRAFLDAYAACRGRVWTAEETRIAWAAGLWNLAFDAKKQTLDGFGAGLASLEAEAEERLKLAGV